MGSTFSGISTALSSLIAQRTALDVAGQNVANANTAGYTRQRADLGAVAGTQSASMFATNNGVGTGVQVTGISRSADPFLDTKLRSQTSGAAALATLSSAYSTLESRLGEPGASGLSAQLQTFWNGWHDVSNAADTISARSVLLDDARQLTETLHTQYQNIATQWADTRTTTASLVTQTNTLATNVADLNKRILDITNNGGNANELSDQRDQALTQLAGLVGATVQTRQDGQVDVYVGGDALVFGGSSHALALAGAQDFSQATGYATDGTPITPQDVHLTWADTPGKRVVPTGGTVAGQLTVLAPPAADDSGTGGVLTEAAKRLDEVATRLATDVNTLHAGAVTTTGTAGGAFFSPLDPSDPTFPGGPAKGPAALRISVALSTADQVAVAAPGGGAYDASVGQQIAALGTSTSGADALWGKAVVEIGNRSAAATSRSSVAESARASAEQDQLANASVDTDEETVGMIATQRAYQAAARVLTTLDDMLDTLINKTGLVGR
ncbi:MAG: flagellar hook-associated protein FlgK [Cellulomonas sp. 73-92]|uniref:flagellar hook-associated protein FlgK n=1 Tax=Cellulomonas sp. 73-92 TaxID=1895740 RepID=UPI000928FAD5|nr:flagellar hook-associated protein FlgK [Cellulomonas sp. 73-92]OJV80715.1 MAG: flagellar hook-associated protein FlgK [Cellulomonas sp. 73-92]